MSKKQQAAGKGRQESEATMSEKTEKTESKGSNGVDQDFVAFLMSQTGGEELAQSAYRKHVLREAFKGRSSSTVTMGEIFDVIGGKGWTEWLRGVNIVDFLHMFTRSFNYGTQRAEGEHRTRQSEASKVEALMAEFAKTPWVTKSDVAKLWNMKAVQGVDKLMNTLVEQGKLKKYRGRTVLFAKADETVPPPA